MIAIVLVATAVPALAQGDRAAERAATQAQDIVQGVDQALKNAQDAEQEADQTSVQGEETGKEKEKATQEATVATIPASEGISTDNVVFLFLGGSALVLAAWLFARRATR